jgi:signal transduction histidine kinase
VDLEISRVANSQRNRIERWQVMAPRMELPAIILFDQQEVSDLHQRLLFMLSTIDMAIILLAGGMGYILAGKTLTPIEESMQEQARFVADSSHELRTPLTALRTSLEVAIRDKEMTGPVATDVMKDNLKEVVRLQNLAESLLELTRTNTSLAISPVELAASLAHATEQVATIAEKKKIEIILPKTKLHVKANPLALERVIVIAIDNAIKYSKAKSKIKILVKQIKRQVMIEIVDNGVGIEADQIDKVFDRFYRADVARSSEVPGYGLGLAIAKELMEQQRGTITINSKIGVGSKVKLLLPVSA